MTARPPVRALLALLALLALYLAQPAMAAEQAPAASPAQASDSDQDTVWNESLRRSLFGDRPIAEGDGVITLDAPVRAEDPSTVPVNIDAAFPQTEDRYIRQVTVLIDKNPVPLAGRFSFTPLSGRADLALRVRINEYTPVRAIAELNDGSLHMSRRFVKASGGCSAPIGTDLDEALTRLGRMKLRFGHRDPEAPASSPIPGQLRISHPNVTGMQMDQLTRMYAPPHYVDSIEVRTGDGRAVFSAETDISISADPSFRFYFVPSLEGELVATVGDNTGKTFTTRFPVGIERAD